MKNFLLYLYICCISFLVVGCAPLKKMAAVPMEITKMFWGSSTQELQKAREDAAVRTYPCQLDQCFNQVLELTRSARSRISSEEKPFELFILNRNKTFFVIMGIPGCIDTTEVGIFLNPLKNQRVQVEIASLSSHAKDIVAEIVFEELDRHFSDKK